MRFFLGKEYRKLWALPIDVEILDLENEAGFNNESYRFRKHPLSSSQTVRLGYASTPKAFRVDYMGEFYIENSRAHLNLLARASGIEILRFYGLGNETTKEEPNDFYRVRQAQYYIDASFMLPLSGGLTFSMGPTFKYSITKHDEDRIIAALQPNGNLGEI